MEKIRDFINDNLTYIIIGMVLFAILYTFLLMKSRQNKYKKYSNLITELDRDKVRVIHTPIDHELAKLNKVIKNMDLLVLLNEWNERWSNLKKDRVREITNAILSAEDNVERRRFSSVDDSIANCNKLIDELRNDATDLYEEIYAVSKLEDTIRDKFIKLKAYFRDVKRSYYEQEAVLVYMKKELELKIDGITDHIEELENTINVNEYEKAESLISTIGKEVEAFSLLITNLPDLLIVVKQFIPRKVVVIENNYDKYKRNDIHLEHLKFEEKIVEVKGMTDDILERMKQLSFRDIEAQIEGIVEYCDNLSAVVDNEVKNYYVYQENYGELSQTMLDVKDYLSKLKDEIDKVKVLYEISNFDENDYLEFEEEINSIDERFNKVELVPTDGQYYYDLNEIVINLLEDSKIAIDSVKSSTDKVLSLREDEQRAREQIVEIQFLVDTSKDMMKNANIPIIPGEFRTYVADAKDGIKYIVDELEKTPICVETLNKRVETSLELAYKLYNNTKRIIKEALLAESAMLYGNRYRSTIKGVDTEISIAERLFFKGEYHDCLNTTVNILEKTEPGIYEELKSYFEVGKGGFDSEADLLG